RVGAHRLEGERGVLQRLALGDARALGGEVDDVGREALGRGLEADPGAGGVLEEEVHDGGAHEGGQLADRAGLGLGHVLGGREDLEGLLAAEVRDRDEVPHARPSPVVRAGRTMSTASVPSVSVSWTCTRSLREVGRFLPTWSARIGSSRWPRSTSTARRTAAGRPMALSASRAARTVRPEKSTSSTSTMVRPSMPPGGIRVGPGTRVGFPRRSSRYRVMSTEPT